MEHLISVSYKYISSHETPTCQQIQDMCITSYLQHTDISYHAIKHTMFMLYYTVFPLYLWGLGRTIPANVEDLQITLAPLLTQSINSSCCRLYNYI